MTAPITIEREAACIAAIANCVSTARAADESIAHVLDVARGLREGVHALDGSPLAIAELRAAAGAAYAASIEALEAGDDADVAAADSDGSPSVLIAAESAEQAANGADSAAERAAIAAQCAYAACDVVAVIDALMSTPPDDATKITYASIGRLVDVLDRMIAAIARTREGDDAPPQKPHEPGAPLN